MSNRLFAFLVAFAFTCFGPFVASAGTLYWDSNGATAGAGATPTGTWGTDSYWTTS